MQNKLKSYNDATRRLMQQAVKYNVQSDTGFSLSEMVHLLRESYKHKLTFQKVFNASRPGEHDPATGFCAVTSYYIYKHTGGDAVWDFMQTPVHWWLRHKQTGDVFDITYTQFDKPFPYEMGAPDTRIKTNTDFNKLLQQRALMLGKCAGME